MTNIITKGFYRITLKTLLWILKHQKGKIFRLPNSFDIIEEIGIFDVNTVAIYDAIDRSLVLKYFRKIAYEADTIRRSKLIDNYQTHIYRRMNDHLIPHDVRFPEIIDPPGVQIDRVVFDGLERQAQLVTGKSTKYFSHYALGAGVNVTSATVKPGETAVDDEIGRFPLTSHGFADAKGSSIAFGCIADITVPTTLITNTAVTDGPVDTDSILYLRTNYVGANRAQTTFNQTFFTGTSIIYQRSK